jgi:hypothetical protein
VSAVPNLYAVVLHQPARAIVSSFDFSHERTPSTVVWFVTKGKPHLRLVKTAVQCAPALMQLSELGVDASTNVTIAGDSRCRRAAVGPPLAQGLHRLGYWARSACARRFPAAT